MLKEKSAKLLFTGKKKGDVREKRKQATEQATSSLKIRQRKEHAIDMKSI